MGGGNWGEGRGREKAGGGQYLSDAKGDVAHVEAPGLSGHLAPDHGHRRRGHSQAVRGHGGEKGGGWNLTRSFENSTAGLDCSRAILHTPPPPVQGPPTAHPESHRRAAPQGPARGRLNPTLPWESHSISSVVVERTETRKPRTQTLSCYPITPHQIKVCSLNHSAPSVC